MVTARALAFGIPALIPVPTVEAEPVHGLGPGKKAVLFPGRVVHRRQIGGWFVLTVMSTGAEVTVLVPATSLAVAVRT